MAFSLEMLYMGWLGFRQDSENRYGDKQNKNRWGLQTANTTR